MQIKGDPFDEICFGTFIPARRELGVLLKISPDHRVCQRAQAILLSTRGCTIEALADIISVHRNTISEWLDLWQTEGVSGTRADELADILKDAPRSGRPSSLTAEEEQILLAEIEENPRSIHEALRSVKNDGTDLQPGCCSPGSDECRLCLAAGSPHPSITS